jgi:hypothetical protein
MHGLENIKTDLKKERVGNMSINIQTSVVKYRKQLEYSIGTETLLNAITHAWVLFSVRNEDDEEVVNFTRVYALPSASSPEYVEESNVTQEMILNWLDDLVDTDSMHQYANDLITANEVAENHEAIVNMS